VFGTNTMPIKLSSTDRSIASDVYTHWAQSLDQYETSPDVSAFSSKFDAFLHDPTTNPLSADEMAGYNLFRGKANCNSCHLDGRSTAKGICGEAEEIRRVLIVDRIPRIQRQSEMPMHTAAEAVSG
jgi:hypothetical protein